MTTTRKHDPQQDWLYIVWALGIGLLVMAALSQSSSSCGQERKPVPLSQGPPKSPEDPGPKTGPGFPNATGGQLEALEAPPGGKPPGQPDAARMAYESLDGCYVAASSQDLSKLLVLNEEGQVATLARSVHLYADRLDQKPTVVCKLYEGWFEPDNPQVKQWRLIRLELVSDEQFQELVNGKSLKELQQGG